MNTLINKLVAIIGAGPVGLALAMRLQQAGIKTVVFEERNWEQIVGNNDERSVNITLSARGIVSLQELVCAERVKNTSSKVDGRKYLIGGKSYFVPYTLLPENYLYSIRRKDLEQILVREALDRGIDVRFNHKLSRIDFTSNSCVFLNAGKTVPVPYYFLYGADGVNSKVRDILNTQCAVITNEYVYKKIDISTENAVRLGLESNAVNIWPAEKGMLLSLPNNDNSHSGLLHIKNIDLDSIYQSPLLLAKYFPEIVKDIDNFQNKFFRAADGVFKNITCDKWFWRNSILLLGDAAHAMLPFYGQGTNCGLEDVMILCELIKKNDFDLSKASCIFQNIRPKATKAISDLSHKNLKNLGALNIEEVLTMKFLTLELEKQFADFRSEYFMVSFTGMPYDEASTIAEKCSSVLSDYISRKNLGGKTTFEPCVLEELHTELQPFLHFKN